MMKQASNNINRMMINTYAFNEYKKTRKEKKEKRRRIEMNIQNVDVQRPMAFQGSGTAQCAPVFEPLFMAIIRTHTDNSEYTIIILITMCTKRKLHITHTLTHHIDR